MVPLVLRSDPAGVGHQQLDYTCGHLLAAEKAMLDLLKKLYSGKKV
jgi:hypothetical protein